ncbi:hypothetical protein [Exiguobacterium sp. S3]|uniref:hypothetical protein n=1 Tax=Exiguobacterium sp. S3 TaxID=483245 RepID=UPI001BE528AB|nr:hypothetical protein [Exiguobacterium sp. S3]
MTKKKKVLTAGAAFAVAAAALTPVASVDAAQKRVIELAPMTFTGGEVKLPAKVGSSKITWYKSGIDMKKVNTWQTIKGYAGTKKVPTTIKIKIVNYVVGFQQSVAPQEVEVDGKLVLPAKLKANFAVGAYYVNVDWEEAKTDKAGDYEVKGTYTRDGKTITVVAKYSVVDADLKIENVSSSVDQAAEVLSVNADVKNLKDGEKVELVVYPGKDMSATPIKETATVKDGKLTVSKKLPAGTHSFQLVSGDVKTAITEFTIEAPMVKEVKVLNTTELKITFNKALNETSAETLANYVVSADAPSAEGTKTVSDVELQDGGKTVIVRFGGATPQLVKNTVYTVEVSNVLTDKFEKVSSFKGTASLVNEVAPNLTSVKFDGKLSLSFDEQVDFTTAVVRVDGVQYSGFTAVSSDAGKYTYEATVTGVAAATGTHNVTIVGLKDVVGTEAGTLSASYSIATDVTAPTVSTIEQIDADTFKLIFSEAVTIPTVKTAKGATEFAAVPRAQVGAQKEWTVDVTNTAGSNNLYNTGENSVALTVEVTNYKDSVNLLGNKYNGTVVLTKDSVAPTVVSTNLNTVAASGADTVITIPFSENISVGTGTITVKDPDGIYQNAVASVTGGKNLVLTITGQTPKSGTYAIALGSKAVSDVDTNGNVALSTSASYSVSTSNFELLATAATAAKSVIGGKVVNYIDVAYGTEMDNSAISVSNYKLDNAALPAGSTVGFVGNKESVRITLPDTFNVPANASYKFEITKSVKTANGRSVVLDDGAASISSTVFTKFLTLTDSKAPTLVSAKLLNAGAAVTTTADQVELTFNEDLGAVANNAANLDDFIVKVNGITIAPTAINDGTAGDKTVVLAIPNFNAAQTLTVEVASSSLNITDVEGNVLTGGTILSATK